MSPPGQGTCGWASDRSHLLPSVSAAALTWRSPSWVIHRLRPGQLAASRSSIQASLGRIVPNQAQVLRAGDAPRQLSAEVLVGEMRQGLSAGVTTPLRVSQHVGTSHPHKPVSKEMRQKIVVNPAGKAFVKSLRTCCSLSELHSLTTQYSPNLDCQAVTALASHLADRMSQIPSHKDHQEQMSGDLKEQECKDTPEQIQRFMRVEWLPLFRRWLPEMDSSGICICVQSAAKVRQHGAELRFREEGCSADGETGDTVMDDHDLDAVMQAVDGVLHSFSTRSAVQLLWGLVSQVWPWCAMLSFLPCSDTSLKSHF